ncbi:MAG: hypothetical protein GQ582_02470 [Methyloprofundus sp.]|nr:hypothetical protein [Methyloprofundus sp.]
MGYTKDKADKLIDEHESNARDLDKQADAAEESETFDRRHSKDLRGQAGRERDKADNQRALKKSWGDE